MPTCHDFAVDRLRHRAIKESTLHEYLATLRILEIDLLPVESITVAMLNSRLQRVLTTSTRRKHAINLRACLGLAIPCPRPTTKNYDLPSPADLHQALVDSSYELWGMVMLYAGLRLGEACTRQQVDGNYLIVDRQRRPDGTLASAKTCGPVLMPEWLTSRYAEHDFERSANTVYVGIRRAGTKKGLILKPHLLRHAFATNLVAAGATPEILRRQMRHHDVSVSLRYYVQTTQDDVHRVVEAMSRANSSTENARPRAL